jgi:phage portal protein BeeE
MRQRMRWLVVARLEQACLSASQIAAVTGKNPRTIQRTLDQAAYQEWRDARVSKGVSAIDYLLAQDAQEMKANLRELIPAAIYHLESALKSTDENVALRAAIEILDRDERFNKTQQVAVMHLIPQAELDRARILARELRKSSTSTPEIKGETEVLDVTPKLAENNQTVDNKEDN